MTLNQSLKTVEVIRLLELGTMSHEEISRELNIDRLFISKVANKYGYKPLKNPKLRHKYHWDGDIAYQIRLGYMRGEKKNNLARTFCLPQRYVEYVLTDWVFPNDCPEGWQPKPTKYPKEVVEAIRNEPKGVKHEDIAQKYDVSVSLVRIVKNRNWQ